MNYVSKALARLLALVALTGATVFGAGLANAQEAGKILMAIGEVSIKRDGAIIPAKRGMSVNSGDCVS